MSRSRLAPSLSDLADVAGLPAAGGDLLQWNAPKRRWEVRSITEAGVQGTILWGDGLTFSDPTASIDYNATNLKITASQLDTIQSIAPEASPTFADEYLTGNLVVDGGDIGITADADLLGLASGVLAVRGSLGVGAASPLGKLHVETADTGGSAHADADDCVVENNATGGITILTPNNAYGQLVFGDVDNSAQAAIAYNHSTNILSLRAGINTEIQIYDTHVSLGGPTMPTGGSGTLQFGASWGQPTMASNCCGIYGYDVSGTTEMFVVDEAGNDTQISSHRHDTGEYVVRSSNKYTGRQVEYLIERMARRMEQLTGEQFLLETWRAPEECLDWDAVQQGHVAARETEIRECEARVARGKDVRARPQPYSPKPAPAYIRAQLDTRGRAEAAMKRDSE